MQTVCGQTIIPNVKEENKMIEVLKQALDALELCDGAETADGVVIYTNQEITSLRQAIAEAEKQEPNGYLWFTQHMEHRFTHYKPRPEQVFIGKPIPLYTHPPQRTWVGLTDEDDIDWDGTGNLKQLVEAVEAKLKEKNT